MHTFRTCLHRKRFSQLASALQLKGQVVKEKVSARRRSVYYQGLLKKTEDAKENTSEKLQEEIDKVRVVITSLVLAVPRSVGLVFSSFVV